jgi:hypothetical protein
MTRSIRRGHMRLQSYVEPQLAERVDRYCAATGISESALIKSSVSQYLDGTSDVTLLDRLGRALERVHRDLELLCEGFAVFVRLWLAHTPTIPEDGSALHARAPRAVASSSSSTSPSNTRAGGASSTICRKSTSPTTRSSPLRPGGPQTPAARMRKSCGALPPVRRSPDRFAQIGSAACGQI